jgi:hypothetical protein
MEVNVLAVCNVLSADLCDPSAALRFIGFTDVITAEVRRTAEIRREDFEAKPLKAAIEYTATGVSRFSSV